MKHQNEKILQLISERDSKIREYNQQIQLELDKEKSKQRFDWKYFIFSISLVLLFFSAIELNKQLFPKSSIWSWSYYLETNTK